MIFIVYRDTHTANSTTSEVRINGNRVCFALEPPNPLPAGEYEMWLRWSERNKQWVIAVMDVPGHTNIEVHPGNTPKDTIDCLLPGISRDPDRVNDSDSAFSMLIDTVMGCIERRERAVIRYVDAY